LVLQRPLKPLDNRIPAGLYQDRQQPTAANTARITDEGIYILEYLEGIFNGKTHRLYASDERTQEFMLGCGATHNFLSSGNGCRWHIDEYGEQVFK
jgi:hypothetical protein